MPVNLPRGESEASRRGGPSREGMRVTPEWPEGSLGMGGMDTRRGEADSPWEEENTLLSEHSVSLGKIFFGLI